MALSVPTKAQLIEEIGVVRTWIAGHVSVTTALVFAAGYVAHGVVHMLFGIIF